MLPKSKNQKSGSEGGKSKWAGGKFRYVKVRINISGDGPCCFFTNITGGGPQGAGG